MPLRIIFEAGHDESRDQMHVAGQIVFQCVKISHGGGSLLSVTEPEHTGAVGVSRAVLRLEIARA